MLVSLTRLSFLVLSIHETYESIKELRLTRYDLRKVSLPDTESEIMTIKYIF